jgi:hypothetical protein
MPYSHNTHTDLLNNDPSLQQIIADLDHLGNTPTTPPATVNWQNLRIRYARHKLQQSSTLPSQHLPWRYSLLRKTVLIPLITVLFLATTAFAFAATPLLQTVFQQGSASTQNPIQYSTLGDVNLSQKIGNTTVTLEKGYAEDQNIVLGITANPVTGDSMIDNPSLTTDTGTNLSSSGVLEGDVQNHILAQSMTFSDAPISGSPASLNLSLKIDLIQNGVTTPLTFHFQLPYHRGEIVAPQLQATSHGNSITLQKVTIGKTQTSVEFSSLTTAPSTSGHRITPQIDIQTSNTNHIKTFDYAGSSNDGNFVFRFDNDLSHYHGPWTITVTRGSDTWVFHINV